MENLENKQLNGVDFMTPPVECPKAFLLVKQPEILDTKGNIFLGNSVNEQLRLEKQTYTLVKADKEVCEELGIEIGDELMIRAVFNSQGKAIADAEGAFKWNEEDKTVRPSVIKFSYTYLFIRKDAVLCKVTDKSQINNLTINITK